MSEITYFHEHDFTTEGFDPNAVVTPFLTSDGIVGYRFRHVDTGVHEFVYMNPSSAGDGGCPDVFTYIGENADPNEGITQFFTPIFLEG